MVKRTIPQALFIVSTLFIAIGAGLVSVAFKHDWYHGGNTTDKAKLGGGIACLAVGAILNLAFWVTLVWYCLQRSQARYDRQRGHATQSYQNANIPLGQQTQYHGAGGQGQDMGMDPIARGRADAELESSVPRPTYRPPQSPGRMRQRRRCRRWCLALAI